MAYLDDVKRFARSRRVGAYFGLVPCQDSSAGRERLGHITGDGPATVRKLLCEAAWQGVRRSPTLRAFFERVARGDPDRRKVAIVATARHIAVVAAAMVRTGEAWRESVQAAPQAEEAEEAEEQVACGRVTAGAAVPPPAAPGLPSGRHRRPIRTVLLGGAGRGRCEA